MIVRCFTVFCLLFISLTGRADPPAKPRLDGHGFPLPDGAIARLGNLTFVSPEWINAVAVSPDGKLIASGSRDIYIWNADTAQIVRQIKNPDLFSLLAWSRDGRLLVSMTDGTEFTAWNVATGERHWSKMPRKPASEQNVIAMRFAAADQRLAIVLDDCSMELWDVEKGTLAQTWKVDESKRMQLKPFGKGYNFKYIALSPSGDLMAWLVAPDLDVKNGQSTVFVFETATGRLRSTVKGLRETYGIHLPDEGKTLVLNAAWRILEATSEKYSVVDISNGSTFPL